MHPFCSTVAAFAGGSNVRSPSPSETNTITFCRSPFASIITSCAKMGEGCCLAQTGSAAIVIGLPTGIFPSKRTVPRTDDPAVVGEGPPAFAARGRFSTRQRLTIPIQTKFRFFIHRTSTTRLGRYAYRHVEHL